MDVGATFRSNNGYGPDMAEVVGFRNGKVLMMRRPVSDDRRVSSVSFSLPESFFESDACGWVPFGTTRGSAPRMGRKKRQK